MNNSSDNGGAKAPLPPKPEGLEEGHLKFLDMLRESGATNMLGSPAYLRDAYEDMTISESYAYVDYWMATFGREVRI